MRLTFDQNRSPPKRLATEGAEGAEIVVLGDDHLAKAL